MTERILTSLLCYAIPVSFSVTIWRKATTKDKAAYLLLLLPTFYLCAIFILQKDWFNFHDIIYAVYKAPATWVYEQLK